MGLFYILVTPAARANCIDCVKESRRERERERERESSKDKGVFNDSELPTSNLQRSIREVTKRISRIMLFFSLKPLWMYEGRLSFLLLHSAPDHGKGSRKNNNNISELIIEFFTIKWLQLNPLNSNLLALRSLSLSL
jgi:hypothetical protein